MTKNQIIHLINSLSRYFYCHSGLKTCEIHMIVVDVRGPPKGPKAKTKNIWCCKSFQITQWSISRLKHSLFILYSLPAIKNSMHSKVMWPLPFCDLYFWSFMFTFSFSIFTMRRQCLDEDCWYVFLLGNGGRRRFLCHQTVPAMPSPSTCFLTWLIAEPSHFWKSQW